VYKLDHDSDSVYADLENAWDRGEATPIADGMSAAPWLHAPAYSLKFTLENSGNVDGIEVAQAYVRFPEDSGEPPAVLRGFADITLAKGAQTEVVMTLSRYALSVWDVEKQGWKRPEGIIGVGVGSSSRMIWLNGTIPA
jgi:hypothetical protein